MVFTDWAILFGMIIGLILVSLSVYKYNKSVADFLAANRCAGKYLLGVADGMAAVGSITIIAFFEMYYKAGFSAYWWNLMLLPLGVIIAMTGWIQYRYRQTRVMTMAQFFEIRYSRRLRIMTGILCWSSGAINFAVFPAVAGRFFQYYFSLPAYTIQAAGFQIDLIYAAIMFVFIFLALIVTLMGGQIVVMVTDFIQGLFSNIVLVAIGFYLLWNMDWTVLGEALAMAPKDASLVNPIHSGGVENFNLSFFLIQVFTSIWMYMAWQGNQGYFCAAKTPHDAVMGRVLGNFRMILQSMPILLLPIAAYVFLNHPQFAEAAGAVKQTLSEIAVGSEQLSSQLRTTVAVKSLLPIGLIGGFAAVMFAATIATHDTYLHSWGSIFIQDVVMPIRQTIFPKAGPMSPQQHMRLLRWSITGIAVFIFIFSLLFNLKQDIYMYFALTGMLFTGWAGTVIIGGLYWKYGTTAAAWCSMAFGVLMFMLSWMATYEWQACQTFMTTSMPSLWDRCLVRWPELADRFPINAQFLILYAIIGSIVLYFFVSLLSLKRGPFNLDKMLHRGAYGDEIQPERPKRKWSVIWKSLGISEAFNLEDKCIFGVSYGYIVLFFGTFAVGTIYALFVETTDSGWLSFWRIFCWCVLFLSVILTVWLAIGGIADMKKMFLLLSQLKRDTHDDGTVEK